MSPKRVYLSHLPVGSFSLFLSLNKIRIRESCKRIHPKFLRDKGQWACTFSTALCESLNLFSLLPVWYFADLLIHGCKKNILKRSGFVSKLLTSSLGRGLISRYPTSRTYLTHNTVSRFCFNPFAFDSKGFRNEHFPYTNPYISNNTQQHFELGSPVRRTHCF